MRIAVLGTGIAMWLAFWVRLVGRFGTPEFNLKIVR